MEFQYVGIKRDIGNFLILKNPKKNFLHSKIIIKNSQFKNDMGCRTRRSNIGLSTEQLNKFCP